MSAYISLKLPASLITVILPAMTTIAGVTYTYDERVTETSETRITEDGETRIVDAYDITSYPEVVAAKLNDGILNVSVP